MNIYEMLSRDNYITVNKLIMRVLGISEAVLLSELCYRRQYLERQGALTEDGFFYATVDDIEEETTLSDYNQRKILDKLQQAGIVTVERRGLPAKRYICVHEQALIYLMDFCTDDSKQVPEDFKDCILKISVLNNNNKSNNNKSRTIVRDRAPATRPTGESAEPAVDTSPEKGKGVSEEPKPKGKLVQSSQKTRRSVVQKTNKFITDCEREMFSHKYSDNVVRELKKFFIMLGEQNALLPVTSIREQLLALDKLPDPKQVEAVKGTIQRGWKSLVYQCDELSGKTGKPSVEGDAPYMKPIDAPRISREESLRQAQERGEEIF